jgi:hypothetical protein
VPEHRINIGDVAKIVRLPKYWGAADIRGKMCLVLEKLVDSNYYVVLVEGKRYTVSEPCLEVLNGSESG